MSPQRSAFRKFAVVVGVGSGGQIDCNLFLKIFGRCMGVMKAMLSWANCLCRQRDGGAGGLAIEFRSRGAVSMNKKTLPTKFHSLPTYTSLIKTV